MSEFCDSQSRPNTFQQKENFQIELINIDYLGEFTKTLMFYDIKKFKETNI